MAKFGCKEKISYEEVKELFHGYEPWLNIIFFRWFTLPLTWFVVNYTRITPNQITSVASAFGILSALSYFNQKPIMGTSFFFLSYTFDAIDGKVARAQNTASDFGAWLDIFADRLNLITISIGISWFTWLNNGEPSIFILNAFFLGLFFLGMESRYNVTIDGIRKSSSSTADLPTISDLFLNSSNQKSDNLPLSEGHNFFKRYVDWAHSHSLHPSPISLVEIIVFYFCISPHFNIVRETLFVFNALLVCRIINQQRYWLCRIK